MKNQKVCNKCNGTGVNYNNEEKCVKCKGEGIQEQYTFYTSDLFLLKFLNADLYYHEYGQYDKEI